MRGYDALEPYLKWDYMVLETELKALEGMPDRLDAAKLELVRVVTQVKRTQTAVVEILEGVSYENK